jgi:GDPmannose 4,6-dehydratase
MFGRNYSVAEADASVGDILVGTSSTLKYQDEDTPFIPQSPYAIAKLAAHHLVRNYRDSYEIFGCCGILFNHESERRGENFVTRKITKWIAKLMAALESERVDINDIKAFDDTMLTWVPKGPQGHSQTMYPKLRLGNLDAQRDWGHAKDYVRAMWLMLQEDIPEDYVVATGKTRSVRDFLDIAFERVGISDWEDFVFIDPEFFRPSEVDYLLGIPEKARTQLGWEPEVSFEQLVHGMIDGDLDEELLRPKLQEVQD